MHGSPRFILSSSTALCTFQTLVQNQSTWKQMTLSVTGGLMSGTEGIDLGGGMDGGEWRTVVMELLIARERSYQRTLKKCCQWQDLIAWLVFLTHCNDISRKSTTGDLGRVTENSVRVIFMKQCHLCPICVPMTYFLMFVFSIRISGNFIVLV